MFFDCQTEKFPLLRFHSGWRNKFKSRLKVFWMESSSNFFHWFLLLSFSLIRRLRPSRSFCAWVSRLHTTKYTHLLNYPPGAEINKSQYKKENILWQSQVLRHKNERFCSFCSPFIAFRMFFFAICELGLEEMKAHPPPTMHKRFRFRVDNTLWVNGKKYIS